MLKNMGDKEKLTRGKITENAIRQAIVRIEQNCPKKVKVGRKLSIKSVAEEAGVSRATIHNNYPHLAERIREVGKKTARMQRDKLTSELKSMKEKYTLLRKEYISIRKLNQDMASEMASLVIENQRLRSLENNTKIIKFTQ
jgi:AcrR family transcriptional regulator